MEVHIDPLPFVRRGDLKAVLTNQQNLVQSAGNVRGESGEPLFAYLDWATEAANQLGSFLRPETVRQLVLTDRHHLLLTAGPGLIGGIAQQQRVLNGLIYAEVAERMAMFDRAVKALELRTLRWTHLAMFAVADTSLFMQYDRPFDEIGYHALLSQSPQYPLGGQNVHLLIPLVVVDELDGQKRRNEADKRWRARHALAVIDKLFTDTDAQPVLSPGGTASGSEKSITLELLLDPPNHSRLPRADDEIIDRIVAEQPIAARPFTLLTFDTGMSMRARHAKVPVIKLTEPEPAEKPGKRQRDRGSQDPGAKASLPN